MHPSIHSFLGVSGQNFEIERDGEVINSLRGMFSAGGTQKYIAFPPDTDVCANDWIVDQFGKRYYVEDTHHQMSNNFPFQIKAYYLTEVQLKQKKQEPQNAPIFNINSPQNSVIGINSDFTVNNYMDTLNELKKDIVESSSPDKAELQKIVDLLEEILNGNEPIKKGMFAKFKDAMERNSWITGSVASAILSYLTTLIP